MSERILGLRHSLEKALESDLDEEERLADILCALRAIEIDLELLKQTGLVSTLQSAKKKFQEKPIGLQIYELLGKW